MKKKTGVVVNTDETGAINHSLVIEAPILFSRRLYTTVGFGRACGLVGALMRLLPNISFYFAGRGTL